MQHHAPPPPCNASTNRVVRITRLGLTSGSVAHDQTTLLFIHNSDGECRDDEGSTAYHSTGDGRQKQGIHPRSRIWNCMDPEIRRIKPSQERKYKYKRAPAPQRTHRVLHTDKTTLTTQCSQPPSLVYLQQRSSSNDSLHAASSTPRKQ